MSLANLSSAQWAQPHLSIGTLTDAWVSWLSAPSTSVAWGTQYRAIYTPIRVPRRVVVKELAYASGSTGAGNIDIGIYDAAGTRLASTGSTAKPASAVTVSLDITDTTLGPGLYYIALNSSTTTDTFVGVSPAAPILASYGFLTETLGSVTLPATATWVVPQTLNVLPIVAAMPVTEVS